MSNPNVREAEDLDELQSAASVVLEQLFNLPAGTVVPGESQVRELLQRAYSIGYDAAHQDHEDGNLG